MKIVYFDCFSGAAGDMIIGALLDAGLDKEFLESQINSLNLPELDGINIETVNKCGINATKFTPVIKHHHSHSHSHHHHGHSHHRHLPDIVKIIDASNLTEKAKQNAKGVFSLLAEAEGQVHGKPPEEVHFHEVGATDSIVDIAGICAGLDYLGINQVYTSKLSLGGGTVKCDHGIMPVPAPATARLVEGLPVKGGPVDKELLTPTGAAVIKYFGKGFGEMPEMNIQAQGYGAGTRDFSEIANVVRIVIGETNESPDFEVDKVTLLQFNTDDSTGESIGFLTEKLLDSGLILDITQTPISMKKNRPAIRISILCEQENEIEVQKTVFESGATLGMQKQTINRSKLRRETKNIKTEFGEIPVKLGYLADKLVFRKAEYDICAQIARDRCIPIRQVASTAESLIKDN